MEPVAPAGLSLTDPRDWSIRVLDAQASELLVSGGRLLGLARDDGALTLTLSGYGLDGTAGCRLAPPAS